MEPHGQFLGYLYGLLSSYLESKNLMLLLDSFMLYRDKDGVKQRMGPDLLLMSWQKPAPSFDDVDFVADVTGLTIDELTTIGP